MSSSIIYAGNSSTQSTIVAGTTVQFSDIVRRYGCNCKLSGSNVMCEGSGYYEGTVNLTLEGTAAGTALVQVYANGVAIPYAYASTVTTDGSITSILIPFVIRNNCNCIANTITVIVSGVVTNIINAGIVVEKE